MRMPKRLPGRIAVGGVWVLLLVVALQAVSQAGPNSATTLLAVQDTWIYSQPMTTFGDTTMLVGTSSNVGTLRSLVQFDLGTIPPDAIIDSAELELWYYTCSRSSGCADMVVSVHRLTSEWDEQTASWSGMGSASDPAEYATQAVGGLTETGRWVSWDVTDLVKEWHSGEQADHGLALHGDDGPGENYKVFSTKEMDSELAPRLSVEWHGSVVTATGTPTGTPTTTPTGTPTATSTPTDKPTVTPTPSPTSEATSTPTATQTDVPTVEPSATATPTVTVAPQLLRVYVPIVLRS
jgi:hypothetical protein